MACEVLFLELDCLYDVEASFSECTDGARISRGRISDDRTDVAVRENVVRSELPDHRGPEPATGHLDFSYREIDSCRHRVSTDLSGMLWKVAPAIPLNPTNRNTLALYEVDVNWLLVINGRTVLRLEARQIETLVPPHRHVRSGEPFLQQRKVRTPKLAE